MSELRKHLFFLLEKDGRSLFVNNGIVTSSGMKRFLEYAPIGSKEMQIVWERDKDKIGLDRNFATELQFIRDSKKILDKTHFTENEEREMYLLIQRLTEEYTDTDFAEVHKTIYKGKLDFYTANSGDAFTKISIAENDIAKKIKANESTPYEFPLSEGEWIYDDGIFIFFTQTYVIPENKIFLNALDNGLALVGISPTVSEGETGNFIAYPVSYDEGENGNYGSDNRYFARFLYPVSDVRVFGEIKPIFPFGGGEYRLDIITSKGRIINLVTVTGVTQIPNTFKFDVTFSSAADERLFLQHTRINSAGILRRVVAYNESIIKLSFKSRKPGTYIPAFSVLNIHRKLVDKITGTELNAAPAPAINPDHYITSGDGLRSINDSIVKVNFKDNFQACKVLYGVGLSVEQDKVRMEPYEYYRTTVNPIVLGDVTDFTSEIAVDELANTIRFGYPAQNIEGPNGRSSFHNTSVYSGLRVTMEPKNKDFICPYIADCFAQELLRIKLEDKTTTDSSTDNKVYLIDTEAFPPFIGQMQFYVENGLNKIRFYTPSVDAWAFWKRITISGTSNNNGVFNILTRDTVQNSGGFGLDYLITVSESVTAEDITASVAFSVRRLKRPAFSAIEGIPDPVSIYNVLLAPSFIRATQQKWLNSMFYGFEGKALDFQGTDKNREFKVVYNGVTYDEDSSINIGRDRLFIPRIFVFNVPAPVDLVEIKETSPNRPFSFVGKEVSLIGFELKSSIGLSDGKEQGFRMLCGPDEDIKKMK